MSYWWEDSYDAKADTDGVEYASIIDTIPIVYADNEYDVNSVRHDKQIINTMKKYDTCDENIILRLIKPLIPKHSPVNSAHFYYYPIYHGGETEIHDIVAIGLYNCEQGVIFKLSKINGLSEMDSFHTELVDILNKLRTTTNTVRIIDNTMIIYVECEKESKLYKFKLLFKKPDKKNKTIILNVCDECGEKLDICVHCSENYTEYCQTCTWFYGDVAEHNNCRYCC
jgi:hypothetical protein